MDIEEFEKRQKPKARRSRLEPFKEQIFELKAKGYANWQISEWLEANGVKVSKESVRKFIKSREDEAENAPHEATAPTAEKPVERQKEAAAEPAPKPAETAPETDEEGGRLSAKQKRERLADQYIKPETTNSLFKKRNKE
ncbi:hypothetical protein KD527_004475 [Salmonella enterica subsp. enterica serovar Havana]|nr:hypothetical protein [Salmonella enterica subsp. enterica serovar Havana]